MASLELLIDEEYSSNFYDKEIGREYCKRCVFCPSCIWGYCLLPWHPQVFEDLHFHPLSSPNHTDSQRISSFFLCFICYCYSDILGYLWCFFTQISCLITLLLSCSIRKGLSKYVRSFDQKRTEWESSFKFGNPLIVNQIKAKHSLEINNRSIKNDLNLFCRDCFLSPTLALSLSNFNYLFRKKQKNIYAEIAKDFPPENCISEEILELKEERNKNFTQLLFGVRGERVWVIKSVGPCWSYVYSFDSEKVGFILNHHLYNFEYTTRTAIATRKKFCPGHIDEKDLSEKIKPTHITIAI